LVKFFKNQQVLCKREGWWKTISTCCWTMEWRVRWTSLAIPLASPQT